MCTNVEFFVDPFSPSLFLSHRHSQALVLAPWLQYIPSALELIRARAAQVTSLLVIRCEFEQTEIDILKQMTALESLTLRYVETDVILEALCSASRDTLTALDCLECVFSSLKPLDACHQLRTITLGACTLQDINSLAALSRLSK